MTLVRFALISFVGVFLPASLRAQAPSLLWTTNVGATLFAVDSQTNAYANVGGKVILISPAGQALQTNTICPLPGIARRDGAGNYYFAGSFDGLQDFGGITLLGGCTNCSSGNWAPGWPSAYLAKYTGAGSLMWVVRFGENGPINEVDDLLLDPGGECYTAYRRSGKASLARFGDLGTNVWEQTVDLFFGSSMAITLGGLTASNCAFVVYGYDGFAKGGRVDQAGNRSWLGQFPLKWRSSASGAGRIVVDDLAQPVQVGQCFNPINDPSCSAQHLRKYGAGSSIVWSQVVTEEAHWTLQRDAQANVYLAGTNGMLGKFDNSGSLVWSNNFSKQAVRMVVNGLGNRFLSFSDGSVALLANEATAAPTITASHYSAAGFSFLVQGSAPAYRIWTNSDLGAWSEAVIVSNSGGSVAFSDRSATNAPLRFYRVEPLP